MPCKFYWSRAIPFICSLSYAYIVCVDFSAMQKWWASGHWFLQFPWQLQKLVWKAVDSCWNLWSLFLNELSSAFKYLLYFCSCYNSEDSFFFLWGYFQPTKFCACRTDIANWQSTSCSLGLLPSCHHEGRSACHGTKCSASTALTLCTWLMLRLFWSMEEAESCLSTLSLSVCSSSIKAKYHYYPYTGTLQVERWLNMVWLLCTFVIKTMGSCQALFIILSSVSCSYVVLMDADHCRNPVYHSCCQSSDVCSARWNLGAHISLWLGGFHKGDFMSIFYLLTTDNGRKIWCEHSFLSGKESIQEIQLFMGNPFS